MLTLSLLQLISHLYFQTMPSENLEDFNSIEVTQENLPTQAEDSPTECFNKPETIETSKNEIVAFGKTAKEFYMGSAGSGSFEQRIAKLKSAIDEIINEFKSKRYNDYGKQVCQFYKNCHASNNHGRSRVKETLRIPSYYTLLTDTFERTMNGDFKGGPEYVGNYISWITGTESGSADAFISIKAKFANEYIQDVLVFEEVNQIKAALNLADIPYN